jgi:hypothetical protein
MDARMLYRSLIMSSLRKFLGVDFDKISFLVKGEFENLAYRNCQKAHTDTRL